MENSQINQLRVAYNIKLLRLYKGLTQETLADALGISGPRYAHYEMGTRAIPLDILSAISNHFHVALDAIVKSDLSKVDLKGLMKVGDNRLLFPILIKEDGNYESIEVVPIKASAGYLKGYSDPEFIEKLPRIGMPFASKGDGSYRGFPISGDSMLPIPDGSIVIGKFVERPSEIKDGGTYIIISENGIAYKRVYNKISQEQALLLISDNKIYPPYLVKVETIYEVWEYKGFFSNKIYREDEYSLEALFSTVAGISNEIKGVRTDIKSLM